MEGEHSYGLVCHSQSHEMAKMGDEMTALFAIWLSVTEDFAWRAIVIKPESVHLRVMDSLNV